MLDTAATGLLLVLLGDATRLTAAFAELDKCYTGVIRLGAATNTYDASGVVTEMMPWDQITDAQIQDAARSFVGELMLVPPAFSLVAVAGRSAAVYAARGEPLDLAPEPCHVSSLAVSRERGSRDVAFALTTGRSVHVRSVAHEFGRVLGTVSHLAALRRTAVGGFRVEDAWTLDALVPLIKKYRKAGLVGHS